ncbi:hypothetical protein CC1G_12620 [Coprinopsis cinerea okayama7|uniref:Uncharacterized protein n=1 Tax=Coprinopsis cinerea (strain Okayama-7 / 130 / ATCC MYA-4618 / FGSC 9003) TaxID=240176 RepID=A8P8K7_COPC7|nr:hypothetical protein CC1G_12620 [Coprinopsis cinerea okayama7\|eukprot:XP_001839592.1 hypothetical protein CC1G_12620 [Coprinopsis cinerea okayama7\
MSSRPSSRNLLAQSIPQSPPSPSIPADRLDINVVDLEALNIALQIEVRMDFWSSWLEQNADFGRHVNCGSPHCTQGCTPLDDFMACEACFSNGQQYPTNCGLRTQFLRDTLRSRGGLTSRQITDFLPVYTRFKQTTLDGITSSSSRIGMDGRMFVLLSAARDQLHDVRQSLAPIPHEARSPIHRLQNTLIRARKENARIVCESVRSRQNWMVLSRIIEEALYKCRRTGDAVSILADVSAELERAERLSLIYDADDTEEHEELYDPL